MLAGAERRRVALAGESPRDTQSRGDEVARKRQPEPYVRRALKTGHSGAAATVPVSARLGIARRLARRATRRRTAAASIKLNLLAVAQRRRHVAQRSTA